LNCRVRQQAAPPMPACSVFATVDQSVVPNGIESIFIDAFLLGGKLKKWVFSAKSPVMLYVKPGDMPITLTRL
jgi:hypothetical protein